MPAESSLSAEVTWVDGLQFVARGDTSGAAFVLDGSPQHGGRNSGVRPMEALLISLASCTGMDVLAILRKKRQNVTGFRVRARGVQAKEHPRRYVHIELEYLVRGRGISERAVARSIELSQTRYCGVTASLSAEVTSSYVIELEGAAE